MTFTPCQVQTGAMRLPARATVRRSTAVPALIGLTLLGLAPAASAAGRPAAVRASASAGTPGAARAAAAASVKVGSLTLRKCGTGPLVYCGSILAPLDYSSAASPGIRIGFQFLPRQVTKSPAAGTILAVEGGPGFATTGTEPNYVAMAGSLLRTRNMLLVNLRGTGNSTPLDCRGLEGYGQVQHQNGSQFNRLVAACGRQLNHTWHYRHGGWVHASDLFNTAYSARDVSRVVQDLRLGRVDLYATLTAPGSPRCSPRAIRASSGRSPWTPPIRCWASTRGTRPPP
jgi:hypothetical protein